MCACAFLLAGFALVGLVLNAAIAVLSFLLPGVLPVIGDSPAPPLACFIAGWWLMLVQARGLPTMYVMRNRRWGGGMV